MRRNTITRNPVLILHGWNLSGARFAGLADALRKRGYTVYAPDFPGFGSEPAPDTGWHVADYARYLRTYIGQRDITQPVLIGHSFGGRVALSYAAMFPDSVRRIVLTGTPGYSPVARGKMAFYLIIAKAGAAVFRLPGISVFSDLARKYLYKAAGAHEFYRAEGSMRATFKNIVNDDLELPMRSVGVPCTLVWGENDSIVPVQVAERMKRVIRGAKLVVVPNATHALPLTEPDRFLEAAGGFLT